MLSEIDSRRSGNVNVAGADAMVIVMMGPAGAGKTTVGRALAAELGWRFVDGDGFHPPANVRKMRAGVALTDTDRAPWLAALAAEIRRSLERREHMVLACSALKARYRLALRDDHKNVRFVYLKATSALISERLRLRPGHFFNPSLAASQLAELEEPNDQVTLTVDASLPPEAILAAIRREFGV